MAWSLSPEQKAEILDKLEDIPRILDLMSECVKMSELVKEYCLTGQSISSRREYMANYLSGNDSDTFQVFIDALYATNQLELVKDLLKSSKTISTDGESPFQPILKTRDFRVKPCSKLPDEYQEDCYPHHLKTKGHALIINNHFKGTKGERHGTDVDCNNLKRLLEQLGYEVETKEDLTAEGMLDEVNRFARKEEHKQCHSAVVVVLSHGDYDEIQGNRDKNQENHGPPKYVSVHSLRAKLDVSALKDKPKIFIIQACRGDKGNEEISSDMTADSVCADDDAARIGADGQHGQHVVTAYATVPGYVCWRDWIHGSWFVQAICQVFSEEAHRKHILDLFTKVNNIVTGMEYGTCKQTPHTENSLSKTLYLLPGYHQQPMGPSGSDPQQAMGTSTAGPEHAMSSGKTDGSNPKPHVPNWSLEKYFPEVHRNAKRNLQIVQSDDELKQFIEVNKYVIALSIGRINDFEGTWHKNNEFKNRVRYFDDYASANDDKIFILTDGLGKPGDIFLYANNKEVKGNQLPRAPGNVQMVSSRAREITITWTAPSNVEGIRRYKIYYRLKGAENKSNPIDTEKPVTTWTVRDLNPNTEYEFKVLTKTAFGQSAWSEARWSASIKTKAA